MSDNESIDSPSLHFVDIDKLIYEMRKRPPLYVKDIPEYNDWDLKKTLWEEIYANVVTDWCELSSADQTIMGIEVKKKWRNLRDCFTKELAKQVKYRPGQIKQRKKYLHFDSLTFLTPSIEHKTVSPDTSEPLPLDEKVKEEEDVKPLLLHTDEIAIMATEFQTPPYVENEDALQTNLSPAVRNEPLVNTAYVKPRRYYTSTNTLPAETSGVAVQQRRNTMKRPLQKTPPMSPLPTTTQLNSPQILTTTYIDECDEDKNFAMMLVPMFKRLNESQKHYAKIKILTAMENARQIDNTVIIPPQQLDNFGEQHAFPQFSPDHVQLV